MVREVLAVEEWADSPAGECDSTGVDQGGWKQRVGEGVFARDGGDDGC